MTNKILRTKMCFFMIFSLIIVIFIGSCNNNPKKPQQEEDKNKPPEMPEVLSEMESTILEIMYDIDAVKGLEIAIDQKKKEEEAPTIPQAADIQVETAGEIEPQIKVQKPQEEKSGDGQKMKMAIEEKQIILPLLKEEEIEGSTAKLSQPPNDIEEIWFDIGHKISDLHKKWNVLEADLKDVDSPPAKIVKFEETLVEASKAVKEKNDIASLFALNNLTSYLADFTNSFKSKVPSQIYKMKYHIRQSVLYAYEEEYEQSQEHVEKIKELKNGLQQELLEKGAQHTAEKHDLSISDLEDQIKNKDFQLILMNATIVINNIILMEEAFETSMS